MLWLVTSWHPLADTGWVFFFFFKHFACLCPPPSHTISSCQISPVTLGLVPACLVQLSVSRHRQLLGKVTLLLGTANAVARELGVLSSSNQRFTLFALHPLKCINLRVHAGFIKSVFGLKAGIVNVRSLLRVWSLQISPLPSPCFLWQPSLPSAALWFVCTCSRVSLHLPGQRW